MRVVGDWKKDASGYYRIAAPFSAVQYRFADPEFDFRAVSLGLEEEYDVVWFQQAASAFDEVVARDFQDAGGLVVYDVDDFLSAMPASWPGYGDYFLRGQGVGGNRIGWHKRLLRLADIVTCPTPALANALATHEGVDRAKLRILPNCVLQGHWDTVAPTIRFGFDAPLLGWLGTGTHWDDWSEIVDVIDEALAEVDGGLALLGAPELVNLFPARLAERTMIQPIVPIDQMHKVRKLAMAFDAGLAWATDRLTASRCRSPLKAIQYGAAGVPVIASQTVYGDLAGIHGNAFLCDSPEDLGEAIVEALGAGREKAAGMAGRWKTIVVEQHTYEVNAPMWVEILEEIWNRS